MVPPASIAGDALSIEALAAARRAMRAQQRLAKNAGAVHPAVQPAAQRQQQQSKQPDQPSAHQFSLSHPQGGASVLRSPAKPQPEAVPGDDAAAAAAAEDAAGSAQHEAQHQQADEQGTDAGEGAAEEHSIAIDGDAAVGVAKQPRTQLQRQLQQLRLQSGGVPVNAQQQQQPALITRPGSTAVQSNSRATAQGAHAEEPAAAAGASEAARPESAADAAAVSGACSQKENPQASEAADGTGEAVKAADAPHDSTDAEASRSAWQRIVDSMAAAPTTVRGSADASWRTLQSLPQTLPQALPKALPRPPWQQQWRAPWDGTAAPEAVEQQQPTRQQRLAEQIRGMELRPTARHVLPHRYGAEPAAELAESTADVGTQTARQLSFSGVRMSAVALLQAEASASQAARHEAAAAIAALGETAGAADLTALQQRGRQQQRGRGVEAWHDSERMRSVRFGRERCGACHLACYPFVARKSIAFQQA